MSVIAFSRGVAVVHVSTKSRPVCVRHPSPRATVSHCPIILECSDSCFLCHTLINANIVFPRTHHTEKRAAAPAGEAAVSAFLNACRHDDAHQMHECNTNQQGLLRIGGCYVGVPAWRSTRGWNWILRQSSTQIAINPGSLLHLPNFNYFQGSWSGTCHLSLPLPHSP